MEEGLRCLIAHQMYQTRHCTQVSGANMQQKHCRDLAAAAKEAVYMWPVVLDSFPPSSPRCYSLGYCIYMKGYHVE
jgi:hypothetical protein